MLSRWSDGRLLSNLHRVRMPTTAECSPPKSRYSIGFFMQADKHALISSETSEDITAGDYLVGRIRSNFEANFKAREAKEAKEAKEAAAAAAGKREPGSKRGDEEGAETKKAKK